MYLFFSVLSTKQTVTTQTVVHHGSGGARKALRFITISGNSQEKNLKKNMVSTILSGNRTYTLGLMNQLHGIPVMNMLIL